VAFTTSQPGDVTKIVLSVPKTNIDEAAAIRACLRLNLRRSARRSNSRELGNHAE